MDVPSATSCSPPPVQMTVARIAGTWSSAIPIFFTTAVPVGVWYADMTSTAPSPKICRGGSTKFPAASSRNASRTASTAVLIGISRRTSSAESTFTRRAYSGPDSKGDRMDLHLDLHRDAVVADGHNDLLMLVARRPKDVWSAYFRERWIPQLREGGIDVQVLPVFIDSEFLPEGALRETLRMIEA